MAFKVTDTLNALAKQINKEPVLILQIEGSQYIYGSAPVVETARWDDPRITWDNDIGVTWDGEIEIAGSKPYIITKGKTTRQLSQQLLVDKGGSGSVAVMGIELVDYRGEVARDLSFDQIGDPLGKKATIYMGLKGGRHPQDSIPIIRGYIDDLRYVAGSITVSVAQATNLLRQSAFEKYQSQIFAGIDALTVTIPVMSTSGYIESQDALTSYIRIDDEIMEVTAKTSNQFTVIRSRLGTIAAAHEIDADVSSYYTLEGTPLELALKLLLSKEGNEYTETSYIIKALNRINVTTLITGAIVIDYYNIQEALGIVVGDKINLVGTASNDGVKTVAGFGVLDTGRSYILVEELLTEETGLDLSLIVKSQYNVLPDGIGMDLDFVDTEAFVENMSLYSAAFLENTFKLKDTIEDVRDFIIKDLFTPQGLYLIPRKAKTSCKFTAPPLSVDDIPILNTQNLYDLTKVEIRRSTHQYLLNNIIYRYNEGTLTDDFFDKLIRYEEDSAFRIPTGRRRLEIEARGFPRGPASLQVLNLHATRILSRYRFAARYVRGVKVLFSVGLRIEIGDIVLFGGEDTQLVDLQTGERTLPILQYEVINKDLDAVRGEVTLELLETAFGVDGVFAVFSPSSYVVAGSTAGRILIDKVWDSSRYTLAREEWERWVGSRVRVRSEDYTYDERATIAALDPNTNNGLLLDPPLPSPPPAGAIVELAFYEEYGDTELELVLKKTYTFTMPSSLLTAVTDAKTFQVDPLEIGLYTVGMEVQVHSEDYVRDSSTRIIDDITGNTITLNEDLEFLPLIGDRLEVYNFADAKGYRFA